MLFTSESRKIIKKFLPKIVRTMLKYVSLRWMQKCNCATQVKSVQQKPPSRRVIRGSRMIDKIQIYVRGGSGGQGCPSAGGLGGNGGHVFIKCMTGTSLAPFANKNNRRIIAAHGPNHIKTKMKQPVAKNTFILVPPGTEVKTLEKQLLCEFNKEGEIMKIVNGGRGGSAHTPGFNGMKGERKNIILELKTIADVALTGFPNAGKSSLLRVLSRARPKVGDYPFTTINPMVGSIFYSDNRKITVADLPGLIEDAHLNKGMGHKFLRHIERTKVILLVVDVNGFRLDTNSHYRSPFETTILLLKELALYQDILLERPFFLVLNKMDSENFGFKRDMFLEELSSVDDSHILLRDTEYRDDIILCVKNLLDSDCRNILNVSATMEQGLDPLKKMLYDFVPTPESFDGDSFDS